MSPNFKKSLIQPTVNGCGVDVAIGRADDLDRQMISYISNKEHSTVLDLACGAGGQSARLVQAGAKVTAVDVYDYSDSIKILRQENNLPKKSLQFIKGDVVDLSALLADREFDDCCWQRAVHYLSHQAAFKTLILLRKIIIGRLYVSVTGIETAIGVTYQDKEKPVAERFCRLDSETADTFNIHEPLCLYTLTEFENLLETSGWRIQKSWVSAFGNIKVICD